VIISHDHYDHLDERRWRRLNAAYHPTFFVPLGIKAWLAKVGITNVVEARLVGDAGVPWPHARLCTPASIPRGRRPPRSGNRRLWSSWSCVAATVACSSPATPGYYDAFKEIASAWVRSTWPSSRSGATARTNVNPITSIPRRAVQIFEDLGARLMVPMHFGTFDLNREPFREPPDRLTA